MGSQIKSAAFSSQLSKTEPVINCRLWTTSFWLKTIFFTLFLFSFTASQGQPMSLEQAVKQGIDNNRQLKISAYKVSQAEMKYQQAVDQTIPTLKAQTGYTRYSELDPPQTKLPGAPEPIVLFPTYFNNYLNRVTLSETIFSGFRLKYAKESQQLLQDAAKLDAVKDKDEVVFNIISFYFNLYKLEQSKKIVEENILLLNERIKESQQMEKEGVILHNDVLRIQIQKSNTELARLDLQNNLSVAAYNFNILIGANEKSTVIVDSNEVKDVPALKSFDEYITDALKYRSDLQANATRTKSMENNFKITQNSYYPQIGISGEWNYMRPNPRIVPPVDQFVSTWNAGIMLTWDLTNLYSNQHNVSDSRIQLQQSQEALHQLEDGVKMEVNQNYLTCIQAQQKIEVMKTSLQQAEENFHIMNARYKNGLALTSDYLDANNSLVQARINLALAKADTSVSYYKLIKSTGTAIF